MFTKSSHYHLENGDKSLPISEDISAKNLPKVSKTNSKLNMTIYVSNHNYPNFPKFHKSPKQP